MAITIQATNVYLYPPDFELTIAQVLTALQRIEEGVARMAGELDALKAAVERNTQVDQSAIALIQGIAQQLQDAIAANNPAEVQRLADELNARSDELAQAVAANTPANPSPSGPEVTG